MNSNFEAAAKSAVSLQKKGESMWGQLALFAATLKALVSETGRKEVSNAFKQEEQAFANANPKVPALGTIGSYRSAKTVLRQAIEFGVPIIDAKGKARGKSAVEDDIKACKEPKSAYDKFQTAMDAADKQVEHLDDVDELALAYTLAKNLTDSLAKAFSKVELLAA